MKYFYMIAAAIAMMAAAAIAPPAHAASCSGPCAPISVTCRDGKVIEGPAAQANLLAAACGEQQKAKPAKKRAKVMVAAKPLPPFVAPVPRPTSLTEGWQALTVPAGCDVNQPRPAVDLGQGLTLTCDSQGPVKRGWNIKALGSSEPVRLNAPRGQQCLLRVGGGASASCQIRIKAYLATPNGFMFLAESGQKYEVTKSFGGWSATKL